MGKVLKIVAAVAIGVATAGIGGLAVLAAGFGVISGTTFWAIALAAGSFVFKKLSPSISAEDAGTQIRNAGGSAEPREYLYGTRQTGGHLAHMEATGADNDTLWMVLVVASHEINGFTKYFIDEKEVSIDGSGNVTTSPYDGFISIYTHLGTDAQTVDTNLDAASSMWTSNHRLRGCAYAVVKLTFSADVFPAGRPNVSFEIEGKKVWDTRTSTTAFSDNPVLAMLDYMRDDLIGPNIPLTAFNTAQLNAGANTCEQTVESVANRYTMNGAVASNIDHADVLEIFENCMAGNMVFAGGEFFLHPGEWVASTETFDEDDILAPFKFTDSPSRKDLVNAVHGLFIDPNQAYQPQDYPPKIDAGAEAEDGGEQFWLDFDLPFTTDHKIAQRIAKAMWELHRRKITVEMTTNLRAFDVKAMDIITVSHANYGFVNETFRVMDWQLGLVGDQEMGIKLVLRQEDSTVWDWLESSDLQTYGTPAVPTFFSPWGVNLAIPINPFFLSLPFTGSTGMTQPGLQVGWDTPSAWIQQIQAQYKLNSESATAYRPLPGQTLVGPNQVHFPAVAEDWDVRLRNLSIYGTYSSWATVVNRTVAAGADDATKGAQLGINVLDEAGTLSLFDKHALNSMISGQNLSSDGGAQIDRPDAGFQIYETFRINGVNADGSIAHFQPGEVVTVSAWIKKDAAADGDNNYCRVLFYSAPVSGSPWTMSSGALNNLNGAADTWLYVSTTVTIPAAAVDCSQIRWGMDHTHVTGPGTAGVGIVSVREFKVERSRVATRFAGLGGLVGYHLADTPQITDLAVAKSKIEDLAVSEPYSDVQNPSPQTMILTQNTWDPIDGISIDANFPSGEIVDVWVLLSGSCHTKDSTGYAIDVRLLEEGVEKLLFTFAWGSNDMTTQSEGSFDFNVPLLGRFSGSGVEKTYTIETRLVAPFFTAAGGWQAPEGFRTRDSQLVMRKVAK